MALVTVAVFGPMLAPHDPYESELLNSYAGISAGHWLGTDGSGRDILSRLMVGCRATLIAPLLLVLASTLLGTVLAMSSAWLGGWYDQVVSRVLDFALAIPAVLFALVVLSLWGPGVTAAIVGLLPGYTAFLARVVRSSAMRERSQPYIAACTVQGFSGMAICRRHLLPNLVPVIVAQATAALGYALIDLAALSFLGVGAQPPTSDWGSMVAEGKSSILLGHPAQAIYAGAAIVVAVVTFNAASDRLVARYGRVER